MKKLGKAILGLALALSMCFSMFIPVYAEGETVDTLVGSLIGYYRDGARTDVLRTLDTLKEVSKDDYDQWQSIIDYWDWIENDMVENIGVAPDGLPNDNTHAFVVLGFALKSDGTMQSELVGRLETALASAQKYPNSYILVTGGVKKNGWTEGDRMHDWLVEHGVADNRILVENKSANTAQNAEFSFDILYNHPTIKSISMITSQYHLKRGTILYYAESLIRARELGKTPIKLNGNAGWYREDKTSETLSQKASSLSQIAGVSIPYGEKLPKSKLTGIEVTGKNTYTVGDALDIIVTSTYDTEYSRDVTGLAKIIGFDANKVGKQNVVVVYTETLHHSTSSSEDVTMTAEFEVEVKTAPITVPVNPQPTPDKPVNAVNTGDNSPLAIMTMVAGLAAAGMFLAKRKEN